MQSVFRWALGVLLMLGFIVIGVLVAGALETSGYRAETAAYWRGHIAGAGAIIAIWALKLHKF